MSFVEIQFRGIGEMNYPKKCPVLILISKDERRLFPLPSTDAILAEFRKRLKRQDSGYNFLPEALWQMMVQQERGEDFSIRIAEVLDGQLRAHLFDQKNMRHVVLNAPDAVLLSLIARLPLYCEERLWQHMSLPHVEKTFGDEGFPQISPAEQLERKMQKAVSEKNYELAAELRDKLKDLRSQQENNNSEG